MHYFQRHLLTKSIMSPSSSCRSSLTFLDSSENESIMDKDQSRYTRISQITARGEEHFKRYGGDDIHEPPPKELNVGKAESTLDESMVTWDGPDDPTNPQNWSIKYKWLVTVILLIMTFSAYVQLLSVRFFYNSVKNNHKLEPLHRQRQHQRQETVGRNSS